MSSTNMKTCIKCEEDLPLSEFYQYSYQKINICKPCYKPTTGRNKIIDRYDEETLQQIERLVYEGVPLARISKDLNIPYSNVYTIKRHFNYEVKPVLFDEEKQTPRKEILDIDKLDIERYLKKGLNITRISKVMNINYHTLMRYTKSLKVDLGLVENNDDHESDDEEYDDEEELF